MREKKKRFTVSLPKTDYQKLVALAEGTRPPLPYRYLVELAVVQFLDDPELQAGVKNPIKKGKKNEN